MHLQAIWDLFALHFGFLKIDVLQDVRFTSKLFLSFLNGRGTIHWKEMTDEKWNN